MTRASTLNLGIRYDRYRTFLPEQAGPSGGSFNPATFRTRRSNLKTFNYPVPRIGVIYDLTGAGRTVIKFNYARYWRNSGDRHRQPGEPQQPGLLEALRLDRRYEPGPTPGRGNGIYDV